MDTTTQVISVLILLATVALMAVSTIVTRERIRRQRPLFPFRVIPAYAAVPELVGQSIESSRPIHVSMGSATLGGNSTLLALASAELMYQVSQRAAIGDRGALLTFSDPLALPLGQDTLRRAYQARGRMERFPYSGARWYPAGPRSLAFAAALTAMMGDDNVLANVLVGSFGPELALIMDAAARRRTPVIAASDQLEGQAVAYALSEYGLIGEEMFAAGAYLGDNATAHVAGLLTLDALRWVLIAILLIASVEPVQRLFVQLLRTLRIGG